MPPALKSIDHVHVFVLNRVAAIDWYLNVLGMKPIGELEFWSKDGGPLTITDPSGNVHIAIFESSKERCRSTIALGVGATEFMDWKQHLSEKLVQSLEAVDHTVSWSLYFTDLDGNPYEVTTYEYDAVAEQLRTEA